MKLQLTTPRSTRTSSVRGGGVSPKQLGCIAAVVIVLLVVVFSSDDDNDTQPAAPAGVAAPVASVPPVPVEVPETSTIKPGFKNRRWGDRPDGMREIGRCEDGLLRCYETREAECIELGGETNCSVRYHYFKKRLAAVTFEESFITRDRYRPSMLSDLEAEWGRGTGSGNRREWRSRDSKGRLTIATWTSTEDAPGKICCRVERVRIWSDRLERERLKVEAEPNSPEMRQLQKEIDDYQREQQRKRDRYKM